jgi:hypothetical protein
MKNPLRKEKSLPSSRKARETIERIANSPFEKMRWGLHFVRGSLVLTWAGWVKLVLSLKKGNPAGNIIAAGLVAAGYGLSSLAVKNTKKAGDKLLMACLGREKIANRVAELYQQIGEKKLSEFIEGLGRAKIKGKTSKERNRERKKIVEKKRDEFIELLSESPVLNP